MVRSLVPSILCYAVKIISSSTYPSMSDSTASLPLQLSFMDWAGSSPTPFRCACTREFTQESAYTKHQGSCTKGKKRLFSALSKAKHLLGSAKRLRVNHNLDRQSAGPIIVASSEPGHLANGSFPSADLLQEHAPTSSLNADLAVSPTEIDAEQGLSLAQRRSRRTDIPLPLRYRQYEDVLPQAPPSLPSGYTAVAPELDQPASSADASTSACSSSQAPPFRTARSVFGLIRQFFSSTPPSHDPEEAVTLQDISHIPAIAPTELDALAEPDDVSFFPYPNRSSFELGHWYWHGGAQKSQQSFKELIDIVGDPDFNPDDVRSTPWGRIDSQLGASVYDGEGEEWEDEDAGWHNIQVNIKIPFSRTVAQPGPQPYIAAELYHWSLTSVIREKLGNAQDDEHFHYEPYQLCWNAPHLPREVNIQGELYTSPAFMDAHRDLLESPGEPGCDLPRVVVALMFWSDATQLTAFGNAKLWPLYMYIGNESKYRRCRPSCNLGNHVAYFQKVRFPPELRSSPLKHTLAASGHIQGFCGNLHQRQRDWP